MQTAEVPSDVIAELELGVRRDDGSTEPLTICPLRPVPSAQLACWQCEYQLAGYRTAGRPIYGVDSWQVLPLALGVVEAELSGLWPRLLYQIALRDCAPL